MKIIEVGTGYTSIPAKMGAATEIVVEELSKVFEKENINSIIYDIKDENRVATNLKIKEVPVLKLFRKKDTTLGIMHKLKRVFYSLSLSKQLRKEIKKSDDEICIHFHNQYNMFFFLRTTPKKIRKKVKIFYTVHSYIWNNEWKNIELTIKKKYFQEVFCIKNADKVFVLNKITIEHLTNHLNIPKEKIVQMDNGVNTEIYTPKECKEKDFIFFQSGSICDRKNQLGAIKVLTKILQSEKKYKYLYAGGIIDFDYKNNIDQYVIDNKISENVKYVGELKPGNELSQFYNMAKAFVFPSTAEAFSLVILEAMSCGLPVIMNRKAILEVSSDLEKVILFYENEKEFNKIIEEKILNEKERLKISKLSRMVIEEKYSWDAIAMNYYNEFKKVMSVDKNNL